MFDKSKPLFTIIIPVYNCERYIEKSIHSALNQTYDNKQIIVIDDCSDDKTVDVIMQLLDKIDRSKHIFSFIQNPQNIGKFKSINNVLKNITTDYFLILDGDDYLINKRLEYDHNVLVESKLTGLNMVYGIQSKYVRYNYETKKQVSQVMYGENIITWAYSLVKTIGFYNENRFGGDSDFLIRFYYFYNKTKHFVKYDVLTYWAVQRSDSLTGVYSLKLREKYIKEFHCVYKLKSNDLISDCAVLTTHNFYQLIRSLQFFHNSISNANMECWVDIEFYKKCYVELKSMNLKDVKKHWETIGCAENRLCNLYMFYAKYPNFDHKPYIGEGSVFKTRYQVYGWVYMGVDFGSKYLNKLYNDTKLNFCTKTPTLCLYKNIDHLINTHQIKRIGFSASQLMFSDIIKCTKCTDYQPNTDRYDNVLFYISNNLDEKTFYTICEHNAQCVVLWKIEGCNKTMYVDRLLYYRNIEHIGMGKDSVQTINSWGFNCMSYL